MGKQNKASKLSGNCSYLAKAAAGAAIFLTAGILFATPIASLGEGQLQNPRQVASHTAATAGTSHAELMAVETTSAPAANTWTLGKQNSGCIFSAHCSSAVEVPEPQSLLLVGTGLLSMAGVIRRKLTR